jgi:hypothetical protein
MSRLLRVPYTIMIVSISQRARCPFGCTRTERSRSYFWSGRRRASGANPWLCCHQGSRFLTAETDLAQLGLPMSISTEFPLSSLSINRNPGARDSRIFPHNPHVPMQYDTGNVPPQQKDWWLEEIKHDPTLTGNYLPKFEASSWTGLTTLCPLTLRANIGERAWNKETILETTITFERQFLLCEH